MQRDFCLTVTLTAKITYLRYSLSFPDKHHSHHFGFTSPGPYELMSDETVVSVLFQLTNYTGVAKKRCIPTTISALDLTVFPSSATPLLSGIATPPSEF